MRLTDDQRLDWLRLMRSDNDPRAEGTNGLLKQGATLVEEPGHEMAPPNHEPAEDERSRIVSLLGPTPEAIDDLVRLSGTSPAIVRTVLLELEIAGRLERHGGGLVSLL